MPAPYEFHIPKEQEPTPAQIVNDAIVAANSGEMPNFTSEGLLQRLNLDGQEPDEKTLMERFTDGEISFSSLRAIPPLMGNAHKLILTTNERAANEAQETMARMLGDVISTQINREGDICPGARDMAFLSTREDIIPPEIKEKIAASSQLSPDEIDEGQTDMQELAEEMEFIQQLLPHILGRMMMDTRFGEPTAMPPLSSRGSFIIPIILGNPSPFASEDPLLAALRSMSEQPQDSMGTSAAGVEEAPPISPTPEPGNVCMRALKGLCKQ